MSKFNEFRVYFSENNSHKKFTFVEQRFQYPLPFAKYGLLIEKINNTRAEIFGSDLKNRFKSVPELSNKKAVILARFNKKTGSLISWVPITQEEYEQCLTEDAESKRRFEQYVQERHGEYSDPKLEVSLGEAMASADAKKAANA